MASLKPVLAVALSGSALDVAAESMLKEEGIQGSSTDTGGRGGS